MARLTRTLPCPARLGTLVLVVALGAACGGGGQPPEEPAAAAVAGFALPGDGELPGWSRATEPESYDAENLWEYINGQADFFIDYGFVRVDAAEYVHAEQSSAVVLEVYEMGRPREAFGIFAAERTRGDRPLEIGSGAYLGANILGFWQGEFYVKLTSFDDSPEIAELLTGLAEEISSRIPGQTGGVETLGLFPEEGRVEASERFIPKNFLGQAFLTDAYRVDFTVDGEEIELFIVDGESAAEAESHFSRLEDFYRESGRGPVTLESANEPPILLIDGPSKVVIFRLENRLGGAMGMQSLESGRTAAAALAESMRR